MPRKKKFTSRLTWTVAFLNREGTLLRIQPGNRPAIRQTGTEQEITREVEDVMRAGSWDDVGLPGSTYAAFVMKGDVYDNEVESKVESTKPKFIVYEGGHTTVVT